MDSGVDDGEDTQSPDNHANKCDPFKGVIAPFGYSYDGKLALFVLVPRHSTSRRSFALEAQNLTTQ